MYRFIFSIWMFFSFCKKRIIIPILLYIIHTYLQTFNVFCVSLLISIIFFLLKSFFFHQKYRNRKFLTICFSKSQNISSRRREAERSYPKKQKVITLFLALLAQMCRRGDALIIQTAWYIFVKSKSVFYRRSKTSDHVIAKNTMLLPTL